jgi:hypothetical protein
VTLYRRLFDILSNPTFRSYRSLLTPTVELLLVLLRLSLTGKNASSVPPAVSRRLRFSLPAVMELCYLLVFGHTVLEREKVRKVMRVRVAGTRLLRSLILLLSRLSGLGELLPVMVRLGCCEWALEVLKEMRDHPPSVAAVVLLLLNASRDEAEGCPTLSALTRDKEEESIIRYVGPLVDVRNANGLLLRHTRDLLWQLSLYRKQTAASPPVRPFHYGFNLLEPTYFGSSGLDYHVKFDFLDRQRHRRIDELQSEVREGEEQEEGQEQRQGLERGETEDAADGARESFDSEGEGEDEEEAALEAARQAHNSPSTVQAAHGWMEVQLSEKAVQASQQLRVEDVEEEEKEDGEAGEAGSGREEEEPEREAQRALDVKVEGERRKLQRIDSERNMERQLELDDWLPERWDSRDATLQARRERQQREVEAARTHSVRHFINREAEQHSPQPSAPASSPLPSPTSSPTASFSLASHSAHDLLQSTMFSRSPAALPPAPTAAFPEPLEVVAPSKFLRELNEHYTEQPVRRRERTAHTGCGHRGSHSGG